MKTPIKWLTLDNMDATASLRQHAFIPKRCKRAYTGEEFIGNVSLCGSIWAGNDSEEVEDFEKLEFENSINSSCCRKCYRKYLIIQEQVIQQIRNAQ